MKHFCLIALFLVLTACSKPPEPEASSGARPVPTPRAAIDGRPVIAAFGDSLSAGYGVEPGLSYPDYLQRMLDDVGHAYRIVNAGISGDTSSGGLARVSSVIGLTPEFVILELGGNDGLRGIPIEATRSNLNEIIVELKKFGATVVLAGMTLPPNYGPDYIRGFEKIYTDLAARHRLPLIPFLLEGVAGHRELMQNDGIHPTAEGNRLTAGNVFQVLEPLLRKR